MQTESDVNHWYGFFLALITAIMWGVLPLFLTLALGGMDPVTITWYRFAVAAAFVALLLVGSGKSWSWQFFRGSNGRGLAIAAAGLVINYVLYLKGVAYLNPETAQVLIQLAPFLVMLGGIYIHKELFSRLEWLGAASLFTGMLLFFNNRLGDLLLSVNHYSLGVICIVFAALSWAIYGLLQKQLLKTMNAKQLTLVIYLSGVIVLFPFSQIDNVMTMTAVQFWALCFCCANTIIGYGAFTRAMAVWHASKVSAVIALAPLMTILSMKVAVYFWPTYFVASDINTIAYLGAAMVVCGSMLASFGKGRTPALKTGR